jgi:hypothetical protein
MWLYYKQLIEIDGLMKLAFTLRAHVVEFVTKLAETVKNPGTL